MRGFILWFRTFVVNAKGAEKSKIFFRIFMGITLALGIVVLYIVSYGVLVASLEKTRCKNFIYILYEPVEFLRCGNLPIYRLTESIYIYCGGTVFSYDRKYFNTPRRNIEFYPDGHKKFDGIRTAEGIKMKSWYSNGAIREDCDETSKNRWNFLWDDSGKVIKQSGDFTIKYPDGNSINAFIWIDYADDPYIEKILFCDWATRKHLPLKDMKYLPPPLRPFFLQQ